MIFAVTGILVTLFWPHKIANRPLYPLDLVSVLSPDGDSRVPVSPDTGRFNFLIDANVAELGGRLSTLQLIEQKPKFNTDRANGFPHRYTKTVGIRFLDQNFEKGCSIALELNGSIMSEITKCSQTDGFLTFNFDETIFPGPYTAVFRSDTIDVSRLNPESFVDSNRERWLFPMRGEVSISSAALLYAWTIGEPYKAYLFLGLTLIFFVLGLSKKWNYLRFFLVFILLYSSNILITKALSGHDETAHVEMLYTSIQSIKNPQGPVEQKNLLTFYNNVEKLKHDSDFFRLHSVSPLPPDTCPHKILGYCGTTERPTNLYKLYARVLSPFNLNWENPVVISRIGAVANILIITLVVLFSYLVGGSALTGAVSLLLVLVGAPLAQLASVTNDFPMYCIGLLLAVSIVSFLSCCRSRSINAAVLVLLSFLVFVSQYWDRSWVGGLYPLLVLLFSFAIAILGKSPKNEVVQNEFSKLHALRSGSITAFSTLLLVTVLVYVAASLNTDQWSNVIGFLRHNVGFSDAEVLSFFPSLSLEVSRKALSLHFNTVIGTYVWGHSFYSNIFYRTVQFLLLLASAWGVLYLYRHYPKKYASGLFFLILAGIALHCFTVIIVSQSMMNTNTLMHASTKIRLTAVGLGILLVLPTLGLFDLMKEKVGLRYIGIISWLIGLNIMIFWQSKFFLADVF